MRRGPARSRSDPLRVARRGARQRVGRPRRAARGWGGGAGRGRDAACPLSTRGGTRLVRSVRGRRGGGGGSAGPERGRGCVAGGPAGDAPRVGEDGEAALLEAARGAAAGERGVAAFPRLLCAQVLRARGRPAQPRVPDGEDQRRPAARARARAARAEGERPRPGHLLNLPGARRAGGGYAGGGYAGRRRRGGGGGGGGGGAAGCTVAGHGAHSGRYASRPTHAGALRAPAPHAGASALRRGADACAPPVPGFVRAVSRQSGPPRGTVGPASGPPAAVVEVAVWEVRDAGARARRGGVGDGAHVCKLQVRCRGAAALVLRRAAACESAAARAARAGAGWARRGRRRAGRRRGRARAPRAGRGGQPGPPAEARGGPL